LLFCVLYLILALAYFQSLFINYYITYYLLLILSPLLEFFHMAPKDLWSNTGMFYRQIEQAKQKERRKVRQTNLIHRGGVGGGVGGGGKHTIGGDLPSSPASTVFE
jgi:hypothetical protein